MVAFVFPGQGSQYVGMGRDFYEKYSEVRELFRTAEEILGWKPEEIIFGGEEEKLKQTSLTQPSLYLVSYALFKVWEKCGGKRPDFVLGHSLGEYTALSVSKVFTFQEGLRLVKIRGKLMEETKGGGMLAILGLERKKVQEIVEKVNKKGIIVCANFNSPGQIVVSGEREALEEAERVAKEEGARKVVFLKVSGAFHSPLMEEAKERLKKEMENISFRTPLFPVIPNVSAHPLRDPGEIKRLLIEQMTSPVKWEESIQNLIDKGVKVFVEMGPGKVLCGLIKRIDREVKAFPTDNLSQFEETLSILNRF